MRSLCNPLSLLHARIHANIISQELRKVNWQHYMKIFAPYQIGIWTE